MASSSGPTDALPGMGMSELSAVYGWLRGFCQLRSPEDEELVRAQVTFTRNYLNFLPSELIKGIDVTLDSYLKALAHKEGWLGQTSSENVLVEIGYGTVFYTAYAVGPAHRKIQEYAVRVQQLYHQYDPRNHPHPIDPWSAHLTSRNENGITVTKLRRLRDLHVLTGALEVSEKELRDGIAQGRGLPPVENLPTATTILFNAYLAGASSSSRLRTCRQFFQHLIALYRSVNDTPAVMHFEDALGQLNKEEAKQHFGGLPVEQQGRILALENAKILRGEWLKDALAKLTSDNVQLEEQYPSSRRASRASSLHEHALGHARIAPRKAWRYYGTTAPEWEAWW